MRRSIVVTALAAILTFGRAAAAEFTVTSREVTAGGTLREAQVFEGYGCHGGNASPELTWKDPPSGTKSFAVTAYDPDAPTGSGWWHWVVFDIPATARHLPSGAGDPNKDLAPAGSVQSRTDFGTEGYGGACPPRGDAPHRYVFSIYALKVDRLGLASSASGAMVGCALHDQVLGKATLTARYGRQ